MLSEGFPLPSRLQTSRLPDYENLYLCQSYTSAGLVETVGAAFKSYMCVVFSVQKTVGCCLAEGTAVTLPEVSLKCLRTQKLCALSLTVYPEALINSSETQNKL